MTTDGNFYTWASCSQPVSQHVYYTANNNLIANNSAFNINCGSTAYRSLADWQRAGQDTGSTVSDMISVDAMISRARALLEPY